MGTASHRVLQALAMLPCVAALAGCLATDGQRTLTVASSQYPAAFDAAIAAARDQGFKAVVVDRTTGIVETDARHAGTLLEPWRVDNDGLGQAAANTLVKTRRRVRIEFTPQGWTPPPLAVDGTLKGPALPGSTSDLARFDLQAWSGEVDMQVWVFLEQSSEPGVNLSSYSARLESRKPEVRGDGQTPTAPGGAPPPAAVWNPVGRDEAYERAIGSAIAKAIAAPGQGSDGSGPKTENQAPGPSPAAPGEPASAKGA